MRWNDLLRGQKLGGCFALTLGLLTHLGLGASVSFVGFEEGSPSNGYSVQNWSNPGVPKAHDLGGSEKYGTSGYYQIRPMPWDPGAASIGEPVSAGNDLGTTAVGDPTLYSIPLVLSSLTGEAGTLVNYGGYSIYRGPDGSALYRGGGLSVSVANGPFNTPSGDNSGYFGEVFSFTMAPTMGADFRLGVAVDSVGSGTYAPDYVTLYHSSIGSTYSTILPRNGSADMVFFDVSAEAGETFSAAVWQLAGSNSVAPVGLITFDVSRYKFNVATGQNQTNSVLLSGAPAALVKTGDGNLVVTNANTYGGSTTINQGRLVIGHSNALGDTSTGTVVSSGAQLRLNPLADTEFAPEPLTLSGEGLTGTVGGALRNATNNNTWKGKITLAANATIGAASGTTLTLDVDSGDAIDLVGFNLVIDGAGIVRVNSGIAGSGQISKTGSGQLVISNNVLTATIQSNSVSVHFAAPPADGTFAVLSGPLDAASLASVNVTGLAPGKTATVANSPNLVIQVTEVPSGPTFDTAYSGNSMTDVAPNGLTYLINYAFGGSSTQAAALPSQDFNDPTKLTLVAFVRTNNTAGVLEVVGEAGDALSNFDSANPIPGEVASDQSDAPAGTQKRIFSVPATGERLFLRLKATLTP